MYLMYVDESGDPGLLPASPTRYYILSGIVIHELEWRNLLDQIVDLRRDLNQRFSLALKAEIHAAPFVNNPQSQGHITRTNRLTILRECLDFLSAQPSVSILNVLVDKSGKNGNIAERAWNRLIQRFEDTIAAGNFNGAKNPSESGLIIPDRGNNGLITPLLRKMRRYNPVPNRTSLYGGGFRHRPIIRVIEDPFYKDSHESYLIQFADIVAYFTRQHVDPNGFIRKRRANRYFNRIRPVICKAAAPRDPDGLVRV